jgi:hypothetical protein
MATTTRPDIFEDVLNLEEQYYREGHELGVADGSISGRIEGRVFGLQKGFEKFFEMGKMHGRAAVWEARLPSAAAANHRTLHNSHAAHTLPALSGNARLRKHVMRLAALSDPNDLSTRNSEDDVSEFDDRLKDAQAKTALICRIVGEDDGLSGNDEVRSRDAQGRAVRVRRNVNGTGVAGRNTGEMEDFLGLPWKS